ncbi:type II toxin-antitoxin system HipA family toxin [Myxococcota bacterium]
MTRDYRRVIEVWADWSTLDTLEGPKLMGTLFAMPSRGQEIFSFDYDPAWLAGPHAQTLDPGLGLFAGPQNAPTDQGNFGVFLDSCPDRWGRVLMLRREAQVARAEGRPEKTLHESDYLLGVHDGHRMGALRFRTAPGGPFLDDSKVLASPPWTSLRELEYASLQLERDDAATDPDYSKWLRMLIAPGGSLGGARPKASVLDETGMLWIAKFPSRRDSDDVGAWEGVIHELARSCGVVVPTAQTRRFGSDHRTFLSLRFDRTPKRKRLHFASAMTLLQRGHGDDASTGVSYLELAELIMQSGSQPERDLEQLWRRIVFFVCVSNTDDHLRNHGFLLEPSGWSLSPAYDMNPNPHSTGLKLNISESDNAQDLELAEQVAPYFRVKDQRAQEIIEEVTNAVGRWKDTATKQRISKSDQECMAPAFESSQS